MLFSEVIGQTEVKQQMLAQLASGRVPHAQLLYGPEGCGKLALALSYATALLCKEPVDGAPCGRCAGCKMTAKLEHPDLHFVFPVPKSKEVSDQYMSQWRELLRESPYFDAKGWFARMGVTTQQPHIFVSEAEQILRKISLTSNQGGYRVIIIWHAELLRTEAANKLLNILEEPMPGTAFLLLTDRPDLLLDTIVSRCVREECKALSADEIAEALATHYGLSSADAQTVARSSGGSFTTARARVTQNGEEELFLDMFKLLMRHGFARKVRELQTWSEQVAEWGREKCRRFLQYMHHVVRESYIRAAALPQLTYTTPREADFLKRFAPYVNERNVEGFLAEIDSAMRDIAQNANPRMVFFDLALQCLVLVRK